ncbi:MAG: helix-turn-helix transcriptional regulator [Sandaracinaceae bacterium]
MTQLAAISPTVLSSPLPSEPEAWAVAAPLSGIVARYIDVDRLGPAEMRIPMIGKSLVLVQRGEGWTTDRHGNAGPALVMGPNEAPLRAHRIARCYRFVAAELTTVGAFALFGGALPQPLYHPLHAFVGRASADSLVGRVRRAHSAAARAAALESFLLSLCAPATRRLRLRSVALAARFAQLALAEPTPRVDALQRRMQVSGALLRRAMRQTALTSPKLQLQSARRNRALAQLLSHPERSLTELAHRLDFHDQAHFTRAFKAYAGVAPSKLDRDRASLASWLLG